jgi:hypothetical protein
MTRRKELYPEPVWDGHSCSAAVDLAVGVVAARDGWFLVLLLIFVIPTGGRNEVRDLLLIFVVPTERRAPP